MTINDEDVFTQTDIVKEIHHYFQALYSEKGLNNNFDMNEKFLVILTSLN